MPAPSTHLPASWRAHGVFQLPQGALGLLPATGAHLMLANASPAILEAAIADMAVAVATSIVDSPLAAWPGLQRRSLASFGGSRANVGPQAVAILSAARAIDFESAIHAAPPRPPAAPRSLSCHRTAIRRAKRQEPSRSASARKF